MNDGNKFEFPDLPPELKETLNRERRFAELFPLPGSINVPANVITDHRYRLIQLHEAMHALHHRFRSETRDKIRERLYSELNQGKLDRGPLIPAPKLFPVGQSVPAEFKVLATSSAGICALGQVPVGELLVAMILAQYDELFVEFFSSAAAGAAYWTTCRDFAFDGMKGSDRLLNKSHWYCESPDIFDPHPALWLRLYLLPQIFLKVMSIAMDPSPIKGQVAANLNSQFDALIRPKVSVVELKVPTKSVDLKRTHLITLSATLSDDQLKITGKFTGPPEAVNDIGGVELSDEASKILKSANCFVCLLESAGEVVGSYQIPISICIPFYAATFQTLAAMTVEWWHSSHPLALFRFFLSPEYHEKIQTTANELVNGTPVGEGWFSDVISAAAARLCSDQNTELNLESLQTRAAESLRSTRGFPWHKRLITCETQT